MKGRNVAFDAANNELESSLHGAIGPVPVWASLRAGWTFLLTNARKIFVRVWLAAIILAILESKLQVKVNPDTVSADVMANLTLLSLLYVALYTLMSASLYSLALGIPQRPILAGIAVGPDELRYFATIVIFCVITFVLLLGAALVGAQIAQLAAVSGNVARLSTHQSLGDIQWFRELPLLEQISWAAPVIISILILVWFALRYTFVPLHVIAVRRLALFDGMALTKHNTWRLFGLLLLLAITLEIVAEGLIQALDAIAGTHVLTVVATNAVNTVQAFGDYAVAIAGGHHGAGGSAAPHLVHLPAWLSPTLLTLLNIMAVSVTVGALAYAYRAITGGVPARANGPGAQLDAHKVDFKLL